MAGGGYFRRFVNYHFGNTPSTKTNAIGKPPKDNIGGFINPLVSTIKITEVAMIFDDAGGIVVGWDYVMTGEREGWLKRTGMHTGNKGIVYHHFVMIHAP